MLWLAVTCVVVFVVALWLMVEKAPQKSTPEADMPIEYDPPLQVLPQAPARPQPQAQSQPQPQPQRQPQPQPPRPQTSPQAPVGQQVSTSSIGNGDSRDFLKEAERYLEAPRPLRELVRSQRQVVVEVLGAFLRTGDTYQRKYAAFAMGQLGYEVFLYDIEEVLRNETGHGVRVALLSAQAVIQALPASQSSSDLERRRMLTREYERRINGR